MLELIAPGGRGAVRWRERREGREREDISLLLGCHAHGDGGDHGGGARDDSSGGDLLQPSCGRVGLSDLHLQDCQVRWGGGRNTHMSAR
jgi:hypothetical protein